MCQQMPAAAASSTVSAAPVLADGIANVVLKAIAGFLLPAAAAAVATAGTPNRLDPLAAVAVAVVAAVADSRSAVCSRCLVSAGSAVMTSLKAAPDADVGMAVTNLTAMSRRTGVTTPPGGAATSTSSGTSTRMTAICMDTVQGLSKNTVPQQLGISWKVRATRGSSMQQGSRCLQLQLSADATTQQRPV